MNTSSPLKFKTSSPVLAPSSAEREVANIMADSGSSSGSGGGSKKSSNT
eukprot:CAMPEP_0181122932 /NCGR_PEP_ID=MMETSP1071-20121207/25592_1 /TAXON_ID=35127 /ORGANISM="Thalassiosira sp., Strain NH16" /LENGTH=48 /DNA_ID= /DNA_START= /DNA_END= /DNA_ORIENTATION=